MYAMRPRRQKQTCGAIIQASVGEVLTDEISGLYLPTQRMRTENCTENVGCVCLCGSVYVYEMTFDDVRHGGSS